MTVKERILQEIAEKTQIYRIKQQQNHLRETLGGQTYKGTEKIFNQSTLAWLIVVVTIFLQLISLATTYEGSRMYFGGIHLPIGLSASLLFALAIQSIVFTISHLIRRYFKVWLAMILVLATLCSTYFSYIGIHNHINPPIDYLKERYMQVYNKLNNQYALARDRNVQEMRHDVFELMGEMNATYISLEKKVQENQVLEALVAEVERDEQQLLPQIKSMAKPNPSSYGEDIEGYYEAMRVYNAAVSQMISETTEQDAKLQQELYDQKISAYLGGKSQEAFMQEAIVLETEKEQMEQTIERMYALIKTGNEELTRNEQLGALQMYCLDFITYNEGDAEIFSTILNNFATFAQTDEGTASFEAFKEELAGFMMFRGEPVKLLRDIDEVLEIVYFEKYGVNQQNKNVYLRSEDAMIVHTKMQAELSRAAHQLNQMSVMEEKIDLTAPDYALYNLYILPLKNLILDSEIKEMAWFCFGFAVLIDGLTLLFAMMQGKEKNLLFVKDNKQITEKGKERIESLLLTTIMENYVDEKEENVIESVRAHLRTFLRPFMLMPEGVENGYSMMCSIDKVEDYQVFVAVLCQFNFAILVGGEELSWLEMDEKASKKKYILIKTKFVMWAKQRSANLAFRESYLEALNKIQYPLQLEEGQL